MTKKKSAWRIWAKALGEKSGKTDREADIIACIRTIIFISYMVTNVAIVANAVRHWNDHDRNTVQISRNNNGYLASTLLVE
jgi:hypothetical protein|tara:strand:- start:203 stop:445 length:243 start_codon:yes stop_codon:yes gene_type:complete